MAISSYPPVPATKKNVVTLTSGTSWTVPTDVTSIIVTLIGGGGGGGSYYSPTGSDGSDAHAGELIRSTITTTPGASIAYAIGAGGAANASGGTTSFTGATSAAGGNRGAGTSAAAVGTLGTTANNGGGQGTSLNNAGSAGGAGLVEIEYWV